MFINFIMFISMSGIRYRSDLLPCYLFLVARGVKSCDGSRRERDRRCRDAAREQGGEKSHAIEIYL